MMTKATDFVGTLAKGLRVIEAFGPETPRLAVADVARLTGYDRASARRLLLTLSELGYAEYDGKYFTLTPRILRLGAGALAAVPLAQIVQPWLDQLSERIGESVSVSILDGTDIVYVARSQQRRVMSIGLMPGSRLPAHCTSMGRVMLAALPPAEGQKLVEASDLTPRTVHSLTDTGEIMDELARVRAQGYALVDQEVETGLRSLAVPILNGRGKVEGALNTGVAAVQDRAEVLVEKFLPELQRVQAGLVPLLGD